MRPAELRIMSAVPVSPGPVGFITINVDPVLNLGPLPIHWYGVMYAVAFLAAYQFGVLPYAKRRGLPKAVAEKICVWTIIFGLLGGRLYYVVQQPDLWQNYILHPINIIAFWQGGMAFFGAIIAGFITLAICAWRYGYNPWIALDGGVIFAVVGQPIGRIGNVINGDILGAPSNLPWATAYSNAHAILQTGFSLLHPGAVHRLSARGGVRGARNHLHRAHPLGAASAECASGGARHRLRRAVCHQPADPVRVPQERTAGTTRAA